MIDVVLRRLGDKPQRKRHVTLRPERAPDAANEYRSIEDLLRVGRDYCHRRYPPELKEIWPTDGSLHCDFTFSS
jgi:hypothetical protein